MFNHEDAPAASSLCAPLRISSFFHRGFGVTAIVRHKVYTRDGPTQVARGGGTRCPAHAMKQARSPRRDIVAAMCRLDGVSIPDKVRRDLLNALTA